MGDYHFAAFRVRSEIALPHLQAWRGPAEGTADITVRRGPAAPLQNGLSFGPHLMVDGKGGLFFHSPDEFCMRIEDGRHLAVQVIDRAMEPLIHLRILTVPLGFACYHLGSPPLHAGLIEIEDRLIAICAPSGAGKSTLIATLMERGHTVLSDDLCLTRDGPGGGILAYPGVGTLKLLPPAIKALGLAPGLLAPMGGISPKRLLPTQARSKTEPCPLSALVHLKPGAETLSLTPVCAMEAAAYIPAIYYRPYLSYGLPAQMIFDHVLRTLAAAPLYVLNRPDDLSRVQDVAERMEQFARSLPRP